MAAEDLYNATPIPDLDPLSLGVGQQPMAPQMPQPSMPVAQQPNQKALTLAAIAAMITGGPAMGGLGRGLLTAQQGLEGQRQQKDRAEMLRYEQEQQNYQLQQRQFQQDYQQRQKVLMDAVGSIRSGVSSRAFKSKEQYDQAVEQTAALLQNAYGMRVSPNFFREAARYYAPNEEQLVYETLDKAFKNSLPGTQHRAIDKITYKAPDGTTRDMRLDQAVLFSSYPMVLGPDGQFKSAGDKPLSPAEAAGNAGEYQAIKEELMAGGALNDARLDQKIRDEQAKRQTARKKAEKAALGTERDPAIASLAEETARLRNELLRAQIQGEQQKNAPRTDASEAYSTERKQRMVDQIDELLPRVSSWTVGPGAVLSNAPGTDAADFQASLDTLKSNIAFNELTEMRAASKTGGALGAVSNVELNLLTSALGALSTKQSPESFKKNLNKIKASLQRWEAAKTNQPAAPAAGKTYGKYTFTVEQP